MARDRFTPDFDSDCGDAPLTSARQDIVIGRWQGPRELLRTTGPAWVARGHRIRMLAQACAGSSTVESWLAAEPRSADALVLRAATETARAFNLAIAAGRGVAIDPRRIDSAAVACFEAAEACPEDPTPWVSLISVARLYSGGVRRQELARWWDELYDRDPFSVEGHLQVLHYYSSRWHGSHGLMYDFARDAAGVAPPGSPLPVLVQYARVEEYRSLREQNGSRQTGVGIGQHWSHDGAASDVRRTWQRWITGRPDGLLPPGEVRDLNYLTHAACSAGLTDIAGSLFHIVGRRATPTPWSYTGDPSRQFTKWRKEFLPRG
ncbi:hypothetical protein F3K40_32900 [Streptomyces sp. LBUM 1478]|uniref:DUF4034 domain-containing protein n=1 Tax=Streptomyces scabiei (strain 87.22) TaxID=680198 RepID=C9YVR0_STRSW|nr:MULTISPECIES: hypothetical protein [Streptomyces]MBP5909461.1 hypothetical protein [Streptomyces sp. LBUM 1478]MBP5926837.1 hypothetical protein [Streptomyces sp. LBUM 1479]MBP5880314.1 hypothetical protein [Streptomyces sp. LBUM 1477]MBP5888155.1 hypothetical protein [Streptomyces sp. LBUM 1487]MBP5889265.1 hypothetical protein [Streptomyces sp. LBUM 1481]